MGCTLTAEPSYVDTLARLHAHCDTAKVCALWKERANRQGTHVCAWKQSFVRNPNSPAKIIVPADFIESTTQ